MNKRIQTLEKMLKSSPRKEDGPAEQADKPVAREEDSSSIVMESDCSPTKSANVPEDVASSPLERSLSEDTRNKYARPWEEVNFQDLVDINMDLPTACSSTSPRYCTSHPVTPRRGC